MKNKCLERFNVLRKEKESCDELEELEMEEVVEDQCSLTYLGRFYFRYYIVTN